ncbi:hypothetical protein DFH29DRAFT_187247 [Suillus ampliporus]|nr:hypothetical protein DFH29DRAFT_187247 [Suillus ampliporus]
MVRCFTLLVPSELNCIAALAAQVVTSYPHSYASRFQAYIGTRRTFDTPFSILMHCCHYIKPARIFSGVSPRYPF